MFGLFGRGSSRRRMRRGSFSGGSRLRNAAIAGAGMLALRWWRNRQAQGRGPAMNAPPSPDQAASGWPT